MMLAFILPFIVDKVASIRARIMLSQFTVISMCAYLMYNILYECLIWIKCDFSAAVESMFIAGLFIVIQSHFK